MTAEVFRRSDAHMDPAYHDIAKAIDSSLLRAIGTGGLPVMPNPYWDGEGDDDSPSPDSPAEVEDSGKPECCIKKFLVPAMFVQHPPRRTGFRVEGSWFFSVYAEYIEQQDGPCKCHCCLLVQNLDYDFTASNGEAATTQGMKPDCRWKTTDAEGVVGWRSLMDMKAAGARNKPGDEKWCPGQKEPAPPEFKNNLRRDKSACVESILDAPGWSVALPTGGSAVQVSLDMMFEFVILDTCRESVKKHKYFGIHYQSSIDSAGKEVGEQEYEVKKWEGVGSAERRSTPADAEGIEHGRSEVGRADVWMAAHETASADEQARRDGGAETLHAWTWLAGKVGSGK